MSLVKKVLVIALIVCICTFSLSANPKYYNHDSKEYQLTKLLTQTISVTPPSVVTPVTGDSLLKTLNNIDKDRLPAHLIPVYEGLIKELQSPEAMFNSKRFQGNIDLTASLELNTIANPADNYTPSTVIYPLKDRQPSLEFDFDAMWNDTIYGRTQMMFLKCLTSDYPTSNFSTNFNIGSNATQQHIYPTDAGLSIGNDHASFFLGRGKLNIGNGYTGNLYISDNFLMQDFVKFSFFSDIFDYDFTLTHFDQQVSPLNFAQWMTFDGKNQMRISHSYSTNIYNKVLLSIHAGSLLQTESAIDFRMFNPFIFLHNWKGFDNESKWQNNIIELEINAGLGKGFNMNFQFVLDQIQLTSEVKDTPAEKIYPNALGWLLNFNHTYSTKSAFIETFLEGLLTMPALYLNSKDLFSASEITKKIGDIYNYDFILGYFSSDYSIGDISYSGHRFGPDTIALAVGGKYVPYNYKWDIAYQALFKVHGQKGIKWHDNQDSYLSTGNENLWKMHSDGTDEYLLQLSTAVNYSLTDYLRFNTVMGMQSFWNFQNEKGRSYQNFQFSIGFSFIPTKIW